MINRIKTLKKSYILIFCTSFSLLSASDLEQKENVKKNDNPIKIFEKNKLDQDTKEKNLKEICMEKEELNEQEIHMKIRTLKEMGFISDNEYSDALNIINKIISTKLLKINSFKISNIKKGSSYSSILEVTAFFETT